MKAMILSAGYGKRLKPLTDNLPKALVNYKNVPMINHQIERLKKAGITEIIVNAHHLAEKIIEYFSKNDFGMKIHVIKENEILGTGGGILNAKKFFETEKFFLAVNADIETDFNLTKLIEFHKRSEPLASLLVQKRKSSRYLEFDSNMNLLGRENENSSAENLFAFNGIHVISNKIFSLNYEIKFEDIINLYLEAIKSEGNFVKGFDAGKCVFMDLGKPENLLRFI